MNIEVFRRIAKARPFEPIEILVDGGAKVVVRHPEALWVSPDEDFIVIAVPNVGVDFFHAANISKIRKLRSRRNGRAAS